MDLITLREPATDTEREAIDAVLGAPADRWTGGLRAGTNGEGRVARHGHAQRERRHLLLPALHAAQDAVGHISAGALGYICERLTVPPAEAYGVASFYALFALSERAPRVAHVCTDIACKAAGSDALVAELSTALGPAGASGGTATWEESPCLGHCDGAPAVFCQLAGDDDWTLTHATTASVQEALAPDAVAGDEPSAAEAAPQTAGGDVSALRLLRRVGVVDPSSIDDYRAAGGYGALRRAVELGPDRVIREVKDSKLLGRGGAAFPCGVKWEAVATAPARPHYVVCNADESEPGTFKDRVLMEHDPFALVEAMTIAGYATGAAHGYIYLRGEYPAATRRLAHAIDAARRHGLLGGDVMGAGFSFDLEIRRGAGAYICGEETALMESIEGYRGEPRNKPPFPTQVGLFGQPTAMNNVETLYNVLDIVTGGGPAFTELGTPDSTGTKLFCVSGSVRHPGVYEVPFGATLGALLERAGGLPEGRSLQAALLGGAAGTFVTPAALDLPLTFEDARAAGAALGSGVVLAFDDTADIVDMLRRIAAFFRDESCGQCVPCRVGTVRQEEALARLANGSPSPAPAGDVALLDDLRQVMADASICGLGHTAASAVRSALDAGLVHFSEEPR